MPPRGDETRQRLLDVAEELFALHGVDYVSLREIRLAAGQRNAAAVQYHFGDRAGVLQAIADRHLPVLSARIDELVVQARSTPTDLRAWVTAVVVPLAEYVEVGPSQRAFLRIVADQQCRVPLDRLVAAMPRSMYVAGQTVHRIIGHDVPPDIASERVIMLAQSVIHDCADRARSVDEAGGRPLLPPDAFAANLVDMMTAALAAPSSIPTPRGRPAKRSATKAAATKRSAMKRPAAKAETERRRSSARS